MTEIHINDIERLPEAAAQFIEMVTPGLQNKVPGKNVFAFVGQLGAGKTTFISEVCRQLGTLDDVSSPTFSIINEYDTEKWNKVFHLDCYRLENEDNGMEIGVEDYFYSGLPCFVEWPEKIEGLIPDEAIVVRFKVNEDGSRILTLEQ